LQDKNDLGEFRNPYASPASLPNDAPGLVGDFHPFRSIWTSPRLTIRKIVSTHPELHVLWLICLAGVGETLDRASMRNSGDEMPLAAILAMACVLGPLGGLFGLWIGSHLIRWTGTWIGGTAPREHIKSAMAWASVPSVLALTLWIPQLVLFGADNFTSATPKLDATPLLWIPFLAIAPVETVIGIWGLVLLCNTIAEVQGFYSAWRGLGNLFLSAAVIVVPLMALVFLGVALAAL
jgi:hypothetical protein